MERKEPNEYTRLLYGKSIYEAIQINGSNGKQKDPESVNDNFRYYTIEPIWMNIRLCIFWFLWVLLIVVLLASILSYCCLQIQTCTNLGKIITLNATRA
ncbi:uncharacterized protein LOC100876958 [Megachile rotundata]|uniref:uncharacterized protein LOC100876958 n=1 Tax=Megachile rotundata TaxID=143995 RepID=UPI000614EF23|nr:PREDICTED: uncharacterized protein LOC100876958 [Megachile rotundata]